MKKSWGSIGVRLNAIGKFVREAYKKRECVKYSLLEKILKIST